MVASSSSSGVVVRSFTRPPTALSPPLTAAAAHDTVPKYGNGFVTASKRKERKRIKEEKRERSKIRAFFLLAEKKA